MSGPRLWRSLTARVLLLVAFVALAGSLVTAVALVRTQSQANLDRAADTLSLQADNLADRVAGNRPLAAAALRARLARQGVLVAVARPVPAAPFTNGDVASAPDRPEPAGRGGDGRGWLPPARPPRAGRAPPRPPPPARGPAAS